MSSVCFTSWGKRILQEPGTSYACENILNTKTALQYIYEYLLCLQNGHCK